MNLGWKIINVNRGKGLTGAQKKQNKIRSCKICGKPAYMGNLCESCKQFIDVKKEEERTEKHGKYRR